MTDPRFSLADVIADLEFAAAHWEDLTTARLPLDAGLPWHGLTLLPAALLDERDTQAWAERLERSQLAIGESPAPLNLGVLDTMTGIARWADWLAGHIATPWNETPPPLGVSGTLDPRPALMYAAQRLTWIAGLADDETAAEWIDWAAPVARRMVADLYRTLSLRLDGQLLPMRCPWCITLAGGPTWRVRILPSSPPEIAIMCEGDCEPPLREVDTWWQGRPCWLLPNWGRLAHRFLTPAERLERAC